MIKAIRMRPAEKPFITTEIIYNHRQEHADTNSEMSFLKLSENTSKQLNSPCHLDHFHALDQHIGRLQQRSALRLSEVKKELYFLQAVGSTQLAKGRSGLRFGEIIEENKENLAMTYRKVGVKGDQNIFGCNFQVDENRNYVKEGFVSSKNLVVSQPKGTSRAKEFYSLENSRVSLGKEEGVVGKIKKVNSAVETHGRSRSIGNGSVQLRGRGKGRQGREESVSSKRCGSSIDSCTRRGRVYEQILSLYSIPKLLAMECGGK